MRTTQAYQYGALAPLDWGEDCGEHLWRMNALWNKLVEIDRAAQERFRATVSEDADVADAETALAIIDADRAEVAKERKALRSEARARVDTRFLDERLRQLNQQRAAARAHAKEVRRRARDEAKERLRAEDDERYLLVKEARQTSGLWWANYNAVCQSYDTARIRAKKEGRELQFHRFDGSGRFTVQVQGGMSAEELLTGVRSEVQFQTLDNEAWAHATGKRGPVAQQPGSRRARRVQGLLRLTLYTEGARGDNYRRRYLTLPLVLHREIPPDARIQMVVALRRRVGLAFEWSVSFTLRREIEEPRHSGTAACGIDLGWRQVPEGLRVGYLNDTEGGEGPIVLPQKLVNRFASIETRQAHADEALNAAVACFRSVGDWPDPLSEAATRLRRSPKVAAGRLASFVLDWAALAPDHAPEALATLEDWRRADKHLRQGIAGQRRRALGWRRDIYRNLASELCHRYAVIGLEEFDLRRVARLETADGLDNELHAAARRNRTVAAVSELRNTLRQKAAVLGAALIEGQGKSTRVCHLCGHDNAPADRSLLHWACTGCGAVWDQDANAARNLCDLASGDPRALRWCESKHQAPG